MKVFSGLFESPTLARACCVIFVTFCSLIFVACQKEEVQETAGYVSRQEFNEKMGWACSLPDDASNVRARLESRGTQDNTLYIRFNTRVAAFSTALQQWARDPRFSDGGSPVTSPLPIAKGDYRRLNKKLHWWQPQKIVHGYYISIPTPGGLGVRVWVDKDASVVYACDEG